MRSEEGFLEEALVLGADPFQREASLFMSLSAWCPSGIGKWVSFSGAQGPPQLLKRDAPRVWAEMKALSAISHQLLVYLLS